MAKLLAVEGEIVGQGTGETEANSKLSIDWLLFVRQLKGRRESEQGDGQKTCIVATRVA